MLKNGLYEQIISKGLEESIAESNKQIQREKIDSSEAAKVLSKYVAQITERCLQHLQDNGGDLDAPIPAKYIKKTGKLLVG